MENLQDSKRSRETLFDKDFFRFLYSFLFVIVVALLISAFLNDMYLAQKVSQSGLVRLVMEILGF